MKPNTKWADLPNAHRIDWVVESLKDDPSLWDAAWDAARQCGSAVRLAAWTAASKAGYQEVRVAARQAAWGVTWGTADDAASDAACGAILALIAYDDCDQYLSMSYEELTIWVALSEHPAAVLLLPIVYVREKLHAPALV